MESQLLDHQGSPRAPVIHPYLSFFCFLTHMTEGQALTHPGKRGQRNLLFFLTLESKFGLCIVLKSFLFSISRMLFASILPHSQEVRYHFSSFFRIMGISLLYLLLFCFLPFLFSPLETLIGQKWTFLDLFFMLLKPHRQYYVRIVAYVKKS